MGVVDAIKWACVLRDYSIQNDWVEQQICIKFCIKFEHSSVETIQMATAMGNWWLAALSQHARSCIRFCVEFFGETSNHPGDSAPYSQDLASCDFWLFPKLKSRLKGKRFQTIDEIKENTAGQLMAIGRTVWGPEFPTSGTWLIKKVCFGEKHPAPHTHGPGIQQLECM